MWLESRDLLTCSAAGLRSNPSPHILLPEIVCRLHYDIRNMIVCWMRLEPWLADSPHIFVCDQAQFKGDSYGHYLPAADAVNSVAAVYTSNPAKS